MKKNYGLLYSSPVAVWVTLFFLAPLIIILLYSFMQKGLYGGVVYRFTFDAYSALLNPVFGRVALTTVNIALVSTFVTVLLALPASYFMARSRYRNLMMLLVIIPFWTNFLIRIYAWIAILGNNGFINSTLLRLGLIDTPVTMLYNRYAVIIVLVYTYLPFAILPLFATIEKFDFTLLEAARDLGATKFESMVKVLLPNIRSGLITAFLFTFIPAFGNYAVPQLVGGKDSLMMGNIIARELTITRNWPLASSISVVITLVTTMSVILFMGLQNRKVKKDTEALAV